jgi:hypothetical protein
MVVRSASVLSLTATMLAAGVAGCGNGPSTDARQERHVTSTSSASSRPASSVETVRTRLRAAGYVVADANPGTGEPRAVSALDVRLAHGARVTIYFYRTAADAARAARPFRSLERTNPKQFELRRLGKTLYVGTVEEPAVLSPAAFGDVLLASSEK